MILVFLEKAPTPENPGYRFLFLINDEDTTYAGTLEYEDFSQPPIITGLRTIQGEVDEQLEIILDLLHNRTLLTAFLTNHDQDLEERILSHISHHSTEVSPEAPLVSQEEIN